MKNHEKPWKTNLEPWKTITFTGFESVGQSDHFSWQLLLYINHHHHHHHHHQFDVYNQANITHRPFGNLFLFADLFLSRHFVGETRILRHLATLVSWHRRILPTFLFISKSRLIALAERFKWQKKKSIKNYQARIPKIWMQVDSKIQKAGVKYSNDKSFRAPHSRVNICSSWNPLISKRQISAWYL